MSYDPGKPTPIVRAMTPDRAVVQGQFAPNEKIDDAVFEGLLGGDNLKNWVTAYGVDETGNCKQFTSRLDTLGVISGDDLQASLRRIFSELNLPVPKVVFEGQETVCIRMPIATYITIQDRVRALAVVSQNP